MDMNQGSNALFRQLAIFWLLFWFFLPLDAYSVSTTGIKIVEAEGVGVIVNEDSATARNNAIHASLRQVVEQCVLEIVPSALIGANAEIVESRVYSRYQNYIQNYAIIEELVRDNLYTVRVRATVALQMIREELAALQVIEKAGELHDAVLLTVRGVTSVEQYVRLRDSIYKLVKDLGAIYPHDIVNGIVRFRIQGDGDVRARIDERIRGHMRYSLEVERATEKSGNIFIEDSLR